MGCWVDLSRAGNLLHSELILTHMDHREGQQEFLAELSVWKFAVSRQDYSSIIVGEGFIGSLGNRVLRRGARTVPWGG